MIRRIFLIPLLFLTSLCLAEDAKTVTECEVVVKIVSEHERYGEAKFATLEIWGTDGSQDTLQLDSSSTAVLKLNCELKYMLHANHPHFLNKDSKLDFSEIHQTGDTLLIVLNPACYGGPLTLPNIYFDKNSSTIRPESKIALDGIISSRDRFPDSVLDITAFADNNESPEVDKNRADSIFKYLVDNGFPKEELKRIILGYQPRVIEQDFSFFKKGDTINERFIQRLNKEQAEEARQLNRRVGFLTTRIEWCEFSTVVVDEKKKAPIDGATVTIVGTDGSSQEKATNKDGTVTFTCNCNHSYVVTASHKEYLSRTSKFTWVNKPHEPISQTIGLRYMSGCTLGPPNLYFEFGNAELDKENKIMLEGLVTTMNENPTLVIGIEGYVDHKELQAQKSLSVERTKFVFDYLVAQGIAPERLETIDKGFTPRIIERDMGNFTRGDELNPEYISTLPSDQQEKANQFNRRVAFTVIRKDYTSR